MLVSIGVRFCSTNIHLLQTEGSSPFSSLYTTATTKEDKKYQLKANYCVSAGHKETIMYTLI